MSELEKMLKVALETNFQISKEGMPKGPVPINFGIVVFPGFQAIDAFGPLDALNMLAFMFPLNLSILADTLLPVSTKVPGFTSPLGSDFGQSISPTHTFASPPPLDVLLVPGGMGSISPGIHTAVEFVGKVYPSLKYMITICTGAGVLDGKRATTNKMQWEVETGMGPRVDWVACARWVQEENVWTASGASAGLDAVFAFMAAVYGEEAAEKVARILEYERHRDPSWDPFSSVHFSLLEKK